MEGLRNHTEEAVFTIGFHEHIVHVAGREQGFDAGEFAFEAGDGFLPPMPPRTSRSTRMRSKGLPKSRARRHASIASWPSAVQCVS